MMALMPSMAWAYRRGDIRSANETLRISYHPDDAANWPSRFGAWSRLEDDGIVVVDVGGAGKGGRLEALVNNAGRTMWCRLEELKEPSVIEQLMRVNYLSAAWLTYYAQPHLKKRNGRIVVVSSVAGLNGVPTRTA